MERQTVTFTRRQKSDRTGKKISTSIRVSRTIHQVALDSSSDKGAVFDSVNDFYETGAKLMMIFGRKNFDNIKRWINEEYKEQ